MEISAILSQIDLRQYVLPEFQRGYVWNREQVRSLFTSLYRRYPVGGFLVWTTQPDRGAVRGGAAQSGAPVTLVVGRPAAGHFFVWGDAGPPAGVLPG